MNSIVLNKVTKKFSGQWIFRDLSFRAEQNDVVAITGYNGSGKSTLLQIISGYIMPTGGTVEWNVNNTVCKPEEVYPYISLAAPYLELIEEMTLKELFDFYSKFKPFTERMDTAKLIEIAELNASAHKQIKYFSSGMKQRVKLVIALLSDVPFVLLDEPLSNLDASGTNWFHQLMLQYKEQKIIFISSNRVKEETQLCNKQISIEEFKV